jgi:hypothetical protein
MRDGQRYEILHNGVPRTFRDRRDTALEAARFAKSNAKGDIIELRDWGHEPPRALYRLRAV